MNLRGGGDHFGLLSLIAIEKFILGRWLWHRFYVGSLIMINILAFSSIPVTLAKLLKIDAPSFITVALIVVYIVTMEIWIWIARIKRKAYLTILADIKNECVLDI